MYSTQPTTGQKRKRQSTPEHETPKRKKITLAMDIPVNEVVVIVNGTDSGRLYYYAAREKSEATTAFIKRTESNEFVDVYYGVEFNDAQLGFYDYVIGDDPKKNSEATGNNADTARVFEECLCTARLWRASTVIVFNDCNR